MPKTKEKIRGINEKNGKCAEVQDNKSTGSFQNYDSRRLLMFLYQGWYLHKENKTSFLTLCMANFGMTATSLFEIWTPAWSYMDWTNFLDHFLDYFFGLFFLDHFERGGAHH